MWEWVLLACKIVGLVGAFAGFAGEATSKSKEHSRRKRLWAIGFLAVAIGAEFIDSLLKRQDSREQALRFERLAHPLGSISVSFSYSISFAGDEFKTYRARFVQPSDEDALVRPPLPDPRAEPDATSLYVFGPYLDVDFSRPSPHPPDDDVELGFSILADPETEDAVSRGLVSPQTLTKIAERRGYSYDGSSQKVHGQGMTFTNTPDDRASNGSIVSTVDLAGTELEIRLCPLLSGTRSQSKASELSQRIGLESVRMEFPGRQGLDLYPPGSDLVRRHKARPEESLRVGKRQSPNDICNHYLYDFPSDPKALKKLLNPPD